MKIGRMADAPRERAVELYNAVFIAARHTDDEVADRIGRIEAAITEAVAAEREECAEVADLAAGIATASTFSHRSDDADIHMARTVAAAIRAREDTP